MTDPAGDDRIDDLLDRAVDLPPAGREAFLARECAGDDALKRRLLDLLAAHDLAVAERFLSPAPRPVHELAPGTRVGHYKLVRRLGVGGSGVVYEARHVEMRQAVALKLLDPRLTRDRVAFGRFRREIAALAGLRHPNVVAETFASTAGRHAYLVTELLDGVTLREVIRAAVRPGHGLPVGAACEIGRQAAAGLSALADQHLVHRDLSPSNVFLTRDGCVKLLDFGLVRLADPGRRPEDWLTTGGGPLGNPAYMAPEQHLAPADADPRADLYALGCVLYHLLAGFAPYFDRGPIAREELPRLHASHRPTPLGGARPDLPPEVVAIVEELLAARPGDRPASAGDVVARLGRLADPSELSALPSAMPPLPPADLDPGTLTVHLPRVRRSGRRRLAAVGALLVAAAAVSRIWPAPDAAVPPPPGPVTWEPAPLTAALGREIHPSLSPDGAAVAYVWTGPDGANADLYVKRVGDTEPRRLTTAAADEKAPAWSPDGGRIAFSRHAGSGCVLMTVDPAGGPETELLRLDDLVTHLDWTPDGRSLVFALARSKTRPPGVYLLEVGATEPRLVVPTPAGSHPLFPRVSPDGTRVAFVRQEGAYSERQSLSVAVIGGETIALRETGFFRGLDWSADGTEVVYSYGRSGRNRLWRVAAAGGESAEIRMPLDATLINPVVSRTGGRLAFTAVADEWTVWRLRIPREGEPPPPPENLFASNRSDDAPAYSPDGTRIAFASDRDGSNEVWVYDRAARTRRRVTSFNGPDVGSPQWSPDGRRVVFDSTSGGRSRVYVVDVDAPRDRPREVTTGDLDSVYLPCWTPDGRWIVFASRAGAEERVWKVPDAGGRPVPFVGWPASVPKVAPDGRWVYVLRDGSHLCRVSGDGEQEVRIQGHAYEWNLWAPGRAGVYALDPTGRAGGRLVYRPFDGMGVRVLGEYRAERRHLIGRYPGGRIAVSPDETEVLYVQYSRDGSNIYHVDGFR